MPNTSNIDPLPLLGASPSDAPYFYVRLNQDWRAYLIGAVIDALGYKRAFAGTDAEQLEAQQQVDELIAVLSEDVQIVAAPAITTVHPFSKEATSGSWGKIWNTVFPYQPVVFNTAPAAGDALQFNLALPAGTYYVNVGHLKIATGGLAVFTIDYGAGPVTLFSIPCYSVATLQGQLFFTTLVITDDFEGPVVITVADDPASPGSTYLVALDWITFLRV